MSGTEAKLRRYEGRGGGGGGGGEEEERKSKKVEVHSVLMRQFNQLH